MDRIEKAHQRIIRERFKNEDKPAMGHFFDSPELQSYPIADIKEATLREITHKEAAAVILKYEWLGTMGTTQHHYGIFYKNQIAGAICFGYFQAMQGYATYVGEEFANKGIQLSRGACVHWAHPHSGSKLISYGLREMKEKGYKFSIAFSDPEAGEIGTVYQATNWYYLGFTKCNHWDLYYNKNHKAKSGQIYMNDRDVFKKYGFAGRQKLEEFVKDHPYLEVKNRKSKARYIYLMGNKKENKQMFSLLQDKIILPYPKRSN